MNSDLLMHVRDRIKSAVHELHQAEVDLRSGRPVDAERLRSIHEELSDLAKTIR